MLFDSIKYAKVIRVVLLRKSGIFKFRWGDGMTCAHVWLVAGFRLLAYKPGCSYVVYVSKSPPRLLRA